MIFNVGSRYFETGTNNEIKAITIIFDNSLICGFVVLKQDLTQWGIGDDGVEFGKMPVGVYEVKV